RGRRAAGGGGRWWADAPPSGDRYALVALAEPRVSGNVAPSEDTLIAMLDAASAEHSPQRIVVLASRRVGPGLRAKLAGLAARGASIVSREIAQLAAIERAAQVYSGGGEIGLLALPAGRPVRAFARSFYTGWGLTDDPPAIPQHGFCRT